jgi:hypothetical protein
MPFQVLALITLFVVSSLVLGFLAVRAISLVGGPTGWRAYLLPILAAFGSLYAIGHQFPISLGPQVELFGFHVALLGDWLIGLIGAIAAALAQHLVAVGLGRNRVRG